jgi:hypothetical protein
MARHQIITGSEGHGKDARRHPHPPGAGGSQWNQRPTIERAIENCRRSEPWPYSRVQVCDLQKTFMAQPFSFSELPETVPAPS